MIISRHASKKFDSLFNPSGRNQEKLFLEKYILPVIGSGIINHGLTLRDVEMFCSRCEEFGIEILALETLYESRYGLHTQIVEEYCDEYQQGWWYMALADLQNNGVIDCIIPNVDIPIHALNRYPC